MHYLRFAITLLFFGFSAMSSAQVLREGSIPEIGEDSVVTVGSNIFEKFRYSVMPAYEIPQRIQAKIIFAVVDIPAGSKLISIPTKTKLKACYVASYDALVSKVYQGCLMDDDGDGTFDRVAGNEVQGGKKLPTPVPYKSAELVLAAAGDSFKQVYIYLGSTKDTLRLSYREFKNDMARPAFTEEYTFPLSEKFPQIVAFKNVKMQVNKIDGEGLHYSIVHN